jgi:uncharacterized protein YndB with AHSA1/START domain
MATTVATQAQQNIRVLEVVKEIEIAASIDVVFETALEQLGPMLTCGADAPPLEMKLEPWPGGRWFRELGNDGGHLWGHVQSIRPPDLLELHGPLFMSAAAVSHVLFRLTEEAGLTRIAFSHRAMGLIPHELQDGVEVNKGWTNYFAKLHARVREKLKMEHRG